jgi:flavodoxin
VGGELFEIESVHTYPTEYDAVVEEARKELKAALRPALRHQPKDPRSYDVVLVGFPNWWGTFPMPVATFLTENDWSGKTLIPFCTHEGSRMGKSASDLAKLCPESNVLEGLALRGGSVKTAGEEVKRWSAKLV